MKIKPQVIKDFFAGKKIVMMGLGILGRGVGVADFLASQGAELLITDLKKAEQLAPALKKLSPWSDRITYVLGEHRLQDFQAGDILVKAAGVPIASPYVQEALRHGLQLEMDASWLVKIVRQCLSEVTFIGITGTRGKSTVTHAVAQILRRAYGQERVHLGGNVRGLATLPLLKKIKNGDWVVMELDSWQLQGFGDWRLSPDIAVFTNLLVDHQNYYRHSLAAYFTDKANIYRWQKPTDIIIAGREIATKIKTDRVPGRLISIAVKDFPAGWRSQLLGQHNLFNLALAIKVARVLGIKETIIKKAVADFTGVPGRLEYLGTHRGIKYYNDTTATTPDGVIAALRALSSYRRKIILLGGGADKELSYEAYANEVTKMVKALILFKGSATDKIIASLAQRKLSVQVVTKMSEAFQLAYSLAKRGDVVLLSPGAASFGIFKNEFDRGDQFVAQVKTLFSKQSRRSSANKQ